MCWFRVYRTFIGHLSDIYRTFGCCIKIKVKGRSTEYVSLVGD